MFRGLPILLILTVSIHSPGQNQRPVVHPSVSHTDFSGTVLVQVLSDSLFMDWATKNHPGWVIARAGKGLVTITASHTNLPHELRSGPGVRFADRGARTATVEALPGEFDYTLNAIEAAHASFPAFNGSTVRLSVKEKPFSKEDIDLRGRIDLTGPFDEPSTDHATFMATIAAGAGNTSAFTRGGAWAATLNTSDFERLLPDSDESLTAAGISVQNHSYGVGVENYYGIEAAEYDRQAREMPGLMHVFSSGNKGTQAPTEGPYAGLAGHANLTGQFKVSKNTICVGSSDRNGNVPPLSSRGPAFDGRIKPELIAMGDAGSSEAAAVVSGIALMVQDAWKKLNGTTPPSAVVKAVLINSADDAGQPGPDHVSGYGNANAVEALRTVTDERIRSGNLSQGEEWRFPLTVTEGVDLFKVTVVWTDPPALPFAPQALVNDLDLSMVRLSDGLTYHPWVLKTSPDGQQLNEPATRGEDRLNNTEQITITAPEPGEYEVRVKGHSVPQGPQEFHITYAMRNGLDWTWPVSGSHARPGEPRILRWRWDGEDKPASITYRLLPDGPWTPYGGTLSLTDRMLQITLPDAGTRMVFRISAGEEEVISEPLTLVQNSDLTTEYDCAEGVLLSWKPVEGATGYVLRNLGEQYLEVFSRPADTLQLVTRDQVFSPWFSVSPVIAGTETGNTAAIDYQLQGAGCYIAGFFAEQFLFNGPATFRLNLGTTYELSGVALERKESEGWRELSRVPQPKRTTYTFTDPTPQAGFSRYRAVALKTDGTRILSSAVEIAYAGADDVFVYPNPVVGGEPLNVVNATEDLQVLRLYDQHGRLLEGVEGIGPVKSIETKGYPAGLYLLGITRGNGKPVMRRVIIK